MYYQSLCAHVRVQYNILLVAIHIKVPAVNDSVDRSAAGCPASAGAPQATAKHIAAAC